jgi:hypothetical protein
MFHIVSPSEFAVGWVAGHQSRRPPRRDRVSPGHPIEALESVLLPALDKVPCVMGFSGGRDSSALLAIAVRLARRHGLDPPIPVTNRYPGIPEADERDWQELVIRHLGVTEWVVKEFTDELDLLGPAARRSLRRHGLLWPATAHNREPSISIASGGCYIDGEGGDEILGTFRITPVRRLFDRERRLDRSTIRQIGYAVAPSAVRRRVEQRRLMLMWDRPWLHAEVADWYVRSVAADQARSPLGYPAAVWRIAEFNAVRVAMGNLDEIGRSLDVEYVHPLYDPDFLSALGEFGGRLGHSSRTATMRALFGDLLPDAVLARDTKAYFNEVFIRESTREFIQSWDGSGLDTELVDVEALRAAWSGGLIHAGTFQLIQAAWLAANPPQPSSDPGQDRVRR